MTLLTFLCQLISTTTFILMCHLILSKRLPRKITYPLYLYTIFICIFLAPFSGQYGIPIFLLGAIIILLFHKKDRLYNLLFFQILWAWSVLTDYAVTIPLRVAGYDFDVILTNPPFGTKKGGERATRDDISFQTSNKQLNFLQVIYRSLKADGKARCAVVLPDNVLFAAGDGASVRRELMNFCDLHTILRLPTGIFYAQGVKTNVLFFTRGTTEQDNTTEVAFYDMRTNMDSFGKTRQLRKSDFDEFVAGYEDTSKRTGERWSKFTREEIAKNPDDSLDLGLIRDDSIVDYDDLPDPVESGEEAIANLEEAVDLLKSVVRELRALTEEK